MGGVEEGGEGLGYGMIWYGMYTLFPVFFSNPNVRINSLRWDI